MKARTLTFLAAVVILCAGYARPANAQNDSYTAMATTPGSPSGGQITFNFSITKWSTQDDIQRLGGILKDKGQSALLEELKNMDSGRIAKKGDTGNQIAIAEKWQDGTDTVITMITARRMSMWEQKSRAVSTKYPLSFLQVRLNANGEGKGTLVTSAAVKYDKKAGTYRLDPYGNGVTPVTNVKPAR